MYFGDDVKKLRYYFASIFNLYTTILPKIVYQHEALDPCVPSPCGANAICRECNGVGACLCMSDYFGDPYLGCRPECLQSSDCPFNKACVNMRCADPCLNACGANAECFVVNHSPMCHCVSGYTGNAMFSCHLIPDNGKNRFNRLY